MRAGAFTLIELLVVVAIIAVLAGILVPAVMVARSMAVEAKCRSNLRQVGMGIELYGGDWRGAIPPVKYNQSGWVGNHIKWYELILPYLRWGEGAAPQSRNALKLVRNKNDVCVCPGYTYPDDGAIHTTDLGYGLNYQMNLPDPGQSDFRAPPAMVFYRFRVTHPSTRMMVSDFGMDNVRLGAGGLNDRWADTVENDGKPDNEKVRRHRGRYNVLFVDGHVEFLDRLRAGQAMSQPGL